MLLIFLSKHKSSHLSLTQIIVFHRFPPSSLPNPNFHFQDVDLDDGGGTLGLHNYTITKPPLRFQSPQLA